MIRHAGPVGSHRIGTSRSIALVVGLALAALSGCSGGDASSPSASSPSAPASSAGGSTATGRTEAPGTTRPSTTTPPLPGTTTPPGTGPQPGPPQDLVELRGDGLGVVTFGDAADTTVATLSSVYGPPDADTGWLQEPSGRTRRVSFGPLVVGLRGDPGDERFVSWSYQPDGAVDEPMRTPDGATVGLTFPELEAIVGTTSPVPAGSVYLQCWPSTGGTICATSSSRFAQATPAADEKVSALSAAAP